MEIILPCLRRIIQISHCYTLREDIISYLTDVSERLAQMIKFILTIFFSAGWHKMIVMETTCLQTVEIYYFGGFVLLFVTMCHGLSSFLLPLIKHSCVLLTDIVPVVMEIIQLDNNDGAHDTTN